MGLKGKYYPKTMVDACPANGGVLAQRVLRFCASPVRFVKLWYQTGHPDRIGPRWAFSHL
jgi:hypothetical protein